MDNLTFREYQEIKTQLSQVGFKLLKKFINERTQAKELEAQTYAESLMTLLVREQTLGAAQELRVLIESFENHVDQKLKETKKNEDNPT